MNNKKNKLKTVLIIQNVHNFFIRYIICIFVILLCACSRFASSEPSITATLTPVKIIISTDRPFVSPTPTVFHSTPSPVLTLTQVIPSKSPTAIGLRKLDLFANLKSGEYLLYTRQNYLGVISVTGSEKIEQELPPGWGSQRIYLSPDRKQLILTQNSLDVTSDYFSGSVMILDLESGEIQHLVKKDDCFNYSGGSWSPDGTKFATGCGQNIDIFSLLNGKITQLTVDCVGLCLNVQWSPDGKWLSFSTGDQMAPKKTGIFVISMNCLDNPQLCLEQKRGPLSRFYGPGFGPPGWSPDGKYLAVPVPISGVSLGIDFINLQTGKVERQIEIPGTDYMRNDALVWSHDGGWIAFNQQFDGIYLTRMTGDTPVRIGNFPDDAIMILQWLSIP